MAVPWVMSNPSAVPSVMSRFDMTRFLSYTSWHESPCESASLYVTSASARAG